LLYSVVKMWKVFQELRRATWLQADIRFPRMISAQADGCAPIVRAWKAGESSAKPWENPTTHAAGLRVPGPLGDRLILRALSESLGDAEAVSEAEIVDGTNVLSRATGIDAAPEGGCAVAVAKSLVAQGRLAAESEVVLFNTGSGASYRE
jgi:threonine synthase